MDGLTLAERFDAQRAHLLRVAYGELGSLAEAEDVLQEAWLRLQRVDAAEIRDLRAWLTTTVSRLALDQLRSARVRREAYVGPWLPEPLVGAAPDPAEHAVNAESLSLALLVVLESLSANERVAFVMHDVFGYEFERVAEALGSSVAAARQQASRARRAVEARRPRFPATPEQQRAVIAAFLLAARAGDMTALLSVLDPEVVFTSDGGGVVNAARKPLLGAGRVARAARALAKRESTVAWVDVNGSPGIRLTERRTGIVSIVAFTVDDGRIVAVDAVRNPEKLRSVASGRA